MGLIVFPGIFDQAVLGSSEDELINRFVKLPEPLS